MSGVLLESRPFRPFKSSEEYLYAMKEDLAEWLQTLYPHLDICTENFMERLETGVALCEHANAVKVQAAEYVRRKEARRMLMASSMTKSTWGTLAHGMIHIPEVKYRPTAKAGTFFARDNLSNFIAWCRDSLRIIQCLLFESDDLIMRKNEKHVILCLLEVARRGAKFGMLAPMLVQMERQIDREIKKEECRTTVHCDADSESDEEEEDSGAEPVMVYGPAPQIVTNDLKSLDEMVRDLVERCTCATQFPMIRVSEGKYRIGDTKVLIFVRILRSHVMVRVGGGWDTLSHYLDKHDPCRCRTQHRTTQSAKLVNRVGADLVGSHVIYDRSSTVNKSHSAGGSPSKVNAQLLGPPMNALNRSRSKSPSFQMANGSPKGGPNRSLSPYLKAKRDATNRSPTPPKKGVAKVDSARRPLRAADSSAKTTDDATDHSDNASEVSDEGYRSLGLEKKMHHSSSYEEESERSTSEDLVNDCGLRRTQYSAIYNHQKQTNQNSADSEKKRLNTWDSGRNHPHSSRRRQSRPALLVFPQREGGMTRRSASSSGVPSCLASPDYTSGSSSAPSATKVANGCHSNKSIKDELLRAVHSADDEQVVLEEVKKLLKRYGSLNLLDEELAAPRSPSAARKRKDSKPENTLSKIPAPVVGTT